MGNPDYATVDFFRDDAVAQDPYPYYQFLRSQGPVWREPHLGVYLVSGYDEAIQVYHDPETFSSCIATTGPFAKWPVPLEDGDDVRDLVARHRDELPFSDQLPSFDPPKHTAHRGLLMRLITPKRLKENEEFMWRLADETIDKFHSRGACEFVREYAQPFTLLVVADLLGVPEEDRARLEDRLLGEQRDQHVVGSTSGATMSHTPLGYLYDQFARYIEERRRNPRDDVLTGLALATFPDGTLPDVGDAMRIAANLFAAGGETTARLLSTAMQILGDRPDLQERLRAERELVGNFIEEALRFDGPVKGDFRMALVRTQVGGVEIPAGSILMVLNGAVNRDPRRFEHPDEFRIERPNARQHLAFGHGIHTCAGAPLARAEAHVTIERFLDRTSEWRISEQAHGPAGARRYTYLPTFMLRGLRELHLEFTPA